MRLTILGSGNAAGMPLYGCHCERCETVKQHPTLRRRTASALLEINEQRYLIDAGLTNIADSFPAGSLNGIFLTHFHADHVQGLFHLRWGMGEKIPVYCPPDSQGCDDLFKHPGILDFQSQRKFKTFSLDGLCITPVPLIHSRVTFGYVFTYENKHIAYLTDTRGLPPTTYSTLKETPPDVLILDTTYPPDKESTGHNNYTDSLAIHQQIKPHRTVLTHIGHELDCWLSMHGNSLPENVIAAVDNQVIFPFA